MTGEADKVSPLIFGNEVVRNFPTLITVIYDYNCQHCIKRARHQWTGNQFINPIHPGKGWVETEFGLWLCPEHAGIGD